MRLPIDPRYRASRGARCYRSALPWRSKRTPIRRRNILRDRRACHHDCYRCNATSLIIYMTPFSLLDGGNDGLAMKFLVPRLQY
jgi:hypothetical protein